MCGVMGSLCGKCFPLVKPLGLKCPFYRYDQDLKQDVTLQCVCIKQSVSKWLQVYSLSKTWESFHCWNFFFLFFFFPHKYTLQILYKKNNQIDYFTLLPNRSSSCCCCLKWLFSLSLTPQYFLCIYPPLIVLYTVLVALTRKIIFCWNSRAFQICDPNV